MRSCEEKSPWVLRWKYMMAPTSHRGIWRLKEGGYFVRVRVSDPRTGKRHQASELLRNGKTIKDALRVQDQLRLGGFVAEHPTATPSLPLWSDYAVSLFEGKVAEGRLKSGKTRELWVNVLARLLPAFGRFRVDELRAADLLEWRAQVARWLRDGAPSIRKKDEGTGRLVHLAPVTANGWISILKVICTAMTKHFELLRNPSASMEYFRVGRVYTREQPNAIPPENIHVFLEKMKELYPAHYAMTFLGFVIGARPSALRPLRRSGPEADVDWTKGILLLRRSNSFGDEIMDETKTGRDLEIPLPEDAIRILKEHVAALARPKMKESHYLFPSTTGGMRSRTALDKPFRRVVKALEWDLHLSPRAMRRTFQDMARGVGIHDVVARAISGHETEEMQRHYSTAQRKELLDAVGRVVTIATSPSPRAARGNVHGAAE